MLVFTLVVGLLGGLLAKFLKIPAPFMIGSMLLVAVVSMTMGSLDTLPSMKLFAQIISGAYIGQQVTKKRYHPAAEGGALYFGAHVTFYP